MDRTKAPMGQSLKPARRRLQKLVPKHIRSRRGGSEDLTISGNTHTIPLPSELSDSRWLDHLQRSGLMSASELPLPSPRPRASTTPRSIEPVTPLIPEFSHLAISQRPSIDSAICTSNYVTRQSIDSTLSTVAPLSPHSGAPDPHSLRRSAKTPVFKIGQLERSARQRNMRNNKRASVELIAEQYRALIEAQDITPETEVEDPIGPKPTSDELLTNRRYNDGKTYSSAVALAADHLRQEVTVETRTPLLPPNPSPRSEGTLVGFEEDVIYFKPISFSDDGASLSSPHETDESRSRLPSIQEDDNQMRTCVDLLTKELSSAMAKQGEGAHQRTEALQVWVMIEAYQRLRAQVAAMPLPETDQRRLSTMFDGWLSALHNVHGSLSRRPTISEGQYNELAEDVD